jgi:hypothetical protein
MVSSLRHGADYLDKKLYTRSYTSVSKKNRRKKGTFARYRVSHMEIDCKEQKAPKMTKQIPLVQLIILWIIKKS